MAVIMSKQSNARGWPDPGYMKIYLNSTGNLTSVDEEGNETTYAKSILQTYQEPFEMDSSTISQKKVTLTHTPISGSVYLSILGCLDQIEGEGYYIDGNEIKWDNHGLDGYLDDTDTIIIRYLYES